MIYVIGAGPSGLATGLFLIEKGYDVTIIEKNNKIESTPCGEGCDIDSLNLLPFDSMKYASKIVNGVKFNFLDKYFYVEMPAVVLNRSNWMNGMAEEFIKRGGKIILSKKIEKVDDEFIYTKNEKIKYEKCIGADGPLSIAKEYVGARCEHVVGCQYEIEFKKDTKFLEFYLDKNYSNYYAWIFPKEKSINVGLIGKFSQLDKFLNDKKIKGKIIKKQAGVIPSSRAEKLTRKNVALVGDAACLTNPFSFGGISPAINAAKILAENIENFKEYEKKIKNHEIYNPILLKGKKAVEKLSNKDTKILFKKINGKELKEIKFRDFSHIIIHPSLLTKAYYIEKALLHSLRWGW